MPLTLAYHHRVELTHIEFRFAHKRSSSRASRTAKTQISHTELAIKFTRAKFCKTSSSHEQLLQPWSLFDPNWPSNDVSYVLPRIKTCNRCRTHKASCRSSSFSFISKTLHPRPADVISSEQTLPMPSIGWFSTVAIFRLSTLPVAVPAILPISHSVEPAKWQNNC